MLSDKQQDAVDRCLRWYGDSPEQIFRIFGYAGTGKTTMAIHIAEQIDGKVLFASFTGKAAQVMASKGCTGAGTIHQLIYHAGEKSKANLKRLEKELADIKLDLARAEDPDRIAFLQRTGQELQAKVDIERRNANKPAFSLNSESELRDADLLIIDECSMVNQFMAQDLMSFGVKILVLGDPFQLPPVHGTGYFTNVDDPDVMLIEIHRQARGNPIIDLASRIRNRQSLNDAHWHINQDQGVQILPRSDAAAFRQAALEAEQVLVWRNQTRRNFNARLRNIRDFHSPHPEIGERVICLRNNHELEIMNGSTWDVTSTSPADGETIFLGLQNEFSGSKELEAWVHPFEYQDIPHIGRQALEAEAFDWGYAITVHKSQGSQWDSVLVFDERQESTLEYRRWLYTAVTRAANQLTLVQ